MTKPLGIFLALVVSTLSFAQVEDDIVLNKPLCDRLEPQLKSGDLIFTSVPNFIFERVARDSGGWVSHAAIVFENKDHGWDVYQSHIPTVAKMPFCKFISRKGRRFALRRDLSHNLSPMDVEKMKTVAKRQLKTPYDFHFNLDNNKKTFCSKYVNSIYSEALGQQIGKIETFKELLENVNGKPWAAADMRFWKVWFHGHIPLEQRTLTPESEYEDSQLTTWFDSSTDIYSAL